MMMKIKFISEESITAIKGNKDMLYNDVISVHKLDLAKAFQNDKIIRETSYQADDFHLDMSSERPQETDLENVKRVFGSMRTLSISNASDERIWSAYTLSECVNYMRYRWPVNSIEEMMNHYFFSYAPKRSLFRNGMARLWWIGHLTYDAERNGDKFELTKFICKKQDHINLLLDINFGNNPLILHAVIQALIDAEKAGMNIEREIVRKISAYINTLGSMYLVDCFDPEIVYKKTSSLLKRIV